MTTPSEWTERDGWILMAVFLAASEREASLSEVIAAADVTDHAIPTSGQLSRALSRLSTVGVVQPIGGRYRINADYVRELSGAGASPGGPFSMPEKGKRWLASKTFEPGRPVSVTIRDDDVKRAYAEYVRMLRAARIDE